MVWQLQEFDHPEALNQALAHTIGFRLRRLLRTKDNVVLAVSGGRTPTDLFQVLSRIDLPWSKIHITLIDERCVPADSADSNASLVARELLQNKASDAPFFPLYDDQAAVQNLQALEARFSENHCFPLDIGILGMGNDGHTASLFPCAVNIEALMHDESGQLFHQVMPVTAPHERITFSLPALLQTGTLILHLTGSEKRQVLEKALAGESVTEMPIRAFLHHPTVKTQIYWAP
jgi:6-phosphogluconolactonase